MKEKTKKSQIYRIKVLDIKFKSELSLLDFSHIYYRVAAKCEKDAVKKARALYIKGEKGELIEESPILLKLFSVQCISS